MDYNFVKYELYNYSTKSIKDLDLYAIDKIYKSINNNTYYYQIHDKDGLLFKYKTIVDMKVLLTKQDMMINTFKIIISRYSNLTHDRIYAEKEFKNVLSDAQKLSDEKSIEYNKEIKKYKKDYETILKKYDDDVKTDPNKTLIMFYKDGLFLIRTSIFNKVKGNVKKVIGNSDKLDESYLTIKQMIEMNIVDIVVFDESDYYYYKSY